MQRVMPVLMLFSMFAVMSALPAGATEPESAAPPTDAASAASTEPTPAAPPMATDATESTPAPPAQSSPAAVPAPSAPVNSDFAKGLAVYNQQNYTGAVESFEAAIKANPESAEAYFYLGYSLYKLKKFDESRVAFAQLYKLQPAYRPPLTIPR